MALGPSLHYLSTSCPARDLLFPQANVSPVEDASEGRGKRFVNLIIPPSLDRLIPTSLSLTLTQRCRLRKSRSHLGGIYF